jgi:hypothetical protein
MARCEPRNRTVLEPSEVTLWTTAAKTTKPASVNATRDCPLMMTSSTKYFVEAGRTRLDSLLTAKSKDPTSKVRFSSARRRRQ